MYFYLILIDYADQLLSLTNKSYLIFSIFFWEWNAYTCTDASGDSFYLRRLLWSLLEDLILGYNISHVHPAFPRWAVKAERPPRSERKRRDSFGMYDGYESCSEESTSSSSSEDSDDEVVPSIPASLPIIKNNGQVYTYPDGKAGMGESSRRICNFCFLDSSPLLHGCQWRPSVCWTGSQCCISFPTATCEMCGMVGVRDAFYSKTKRFCSVSCSRSYSSNSKKASILARLQVSSQFWLLRCIVVTTAG